MKHYNRTNKNGNTYRTVYIGETDAGEYYAIERNQKHDPSGWFLLVGLWPYEEAKATIDHYCEQ